MACTTWKLYSAWKCSGMIALARQQKEYKKRREKSVEEEEKEEEEEEGRGRKKGKGAWHDMAWHGILPDSTCQVLLAWAFVVAWQKAGETNNKKIKESKASQKEEENRGYKKTEIWRGEARRMRNDKKNNSIMGLWPYDMLLYPFPLLRTDSNSNHNNTGNNKTNKTSKQQACSLCCLTDIFFVDSVAGIRSMSSKCASAALLFDKGLLCYSVGRIGRVVRRDGMMMLLIFLFFFLSFGMCASWQTLLSLCPDDNMYVCPRYGDEVNVLLGVVEQCRGIRLQVEWHSKKRQSGSSWACNCGHGYQWIYGRLEKGISLTQFGSLIDETYLNWPKWGPCLSFQWLKWINPYTMPRNERREH